MKNSCIITSASTKFFPSLINLLGSIEKNYPNHPDVYVYDIGLFFTMRKELESISWVHILDVPHFVPHWRACYTWKTHILNTPLTENNLYIDAGCQVLRSLDEIFKKIDTQGYVTVSQGSTVTIQDITPKEYINLYNLSTEDVQSQVITAGIFGFKKDSVITEITKRLYESGIIGLCLGFSKTELWKNTGVNKTNFIRDCKMFRHDTTMLTVLLKEKIKNAFIEPVENFSPEQHSSSTQYLWNLRLNYNRLSFLHKNILHKKNNTYAVYNRLHISIFILLKKISNTVKKCFHF